MQNDEQLMLDFQMGSSKAFEELFIRYRQRIYAFFRRRLNHASRAEELAQETFVIIIRDAVRYEARAKFRTYVFGIALKQLWSERRKASRDARLTAEPFEKSTGSDPADALWVRDALSRIEEDHREVLMLREYEDLSYDDIAEVLSIPVNTVRSRLFRARSELRSLLSQDAARKVSQ